MVEHVPFKKIPRLFRDCVITEKIDGTNAVIHIDEEGVLTPGGRNRWLCKADDNFGFACWCMDNKTELLKLGPGLHYGEWWGQGIQRKYGLNEKRLSLFNVHRWCLSGTEPKVLSVSTEGVEKKQSVLPACVGLVPVLYEGPFLTHRIDEVSADLKLTGSKAVPGFMDPEGIVIMHTASGQLFKYTFGNDGHKGDNR
jgi:hypothetical protein